MSKLEIFQAAADKVRAKIRVLRRIREYAAEKGGHGNISSKAIPLKGFQEKNLMFNPDDYKRSLQSAAPRWVIDVCGRQSEDRTKEEISKLVRMMKFELEDFRQYSHKMQILLARIVRYERFGSERVVIRKGHIAMNFYMIISGKVGVVVDGSDDMSILKKGDTFGELELVRRLTRSTTFVCLENTELMTIDGEEFFALGIDKYAEDQIFFRYSFMKTLEVFSTWNDQVLQEMAEVGRKIEFFIDRVIEQDTTESEFVYIIVEGECHVLRVLDLNSFHQASRVPVNSTPCTFKMDVLTQAKIFGMGYILPEEDQDEDCKRRFLLVSAGCEIIRIPKSILKRYANKSTFKMIKKYPSQYLSDKELYKIYKNDKNWKGFREKLVDEVVGSHYNIKIKKTGKK